jgi:hypothetical protein
MVDFEINDEGSIVAITPMNEQAREWIDENVHSEGWQWMGLSLCVDHRMAEPLLCGMVEAGFEIGETFH